LRPADDRNAASGFAVMTHDIPSYFTEETITAINFWNEYRSMKHPPFTKGWTEWPFYMRGVITTLNNAVEIYKKDK